MAARDPLLIVREYLEPSEPPQVRKNALSALAALNNPESLATLAEIAVTERDPQVRERAELELASLPPVAAAQALPRIFNDLKEPSKRREAYALLGRLRHVGLAFWFPALGIGTRVLLARSLRDFRYPNRSLGFHFRSVTGISFGMLVAYPFMLFYLTMTLGVELSMEFVGMVFGMYIIAWVLTVCMAAIGLRLTSPLRYHADVVGAVLLDAVMIAVVSALTAAIVVFLDVVDEPHKGYDGITTLLVTVPCAAMAVRLGTVGAFGLSRGVWRSYLAQIIIGGLCGLAVYQLAGIISGKIATRIVSLSWFWMTLGAFGLAGAYAKIDSEAQPAPVAPRRLRIGTFAVAAVAVLIATVSILPLREVRIELGDVGQLPRVVEIHSVPATITYAAPVATHVTVDNVGSYTATVDPAQQDPGKQVSAHVVRNPDLSNDAIWAKLRELGKMLTWPQLKARLTQGEPRDGPTMVNVTIAEAPPRENPSAQ